ncbi:uncharacterized protein SCHCODRAFT_02360884 [Schizophyllum commune H4-8]|uniref:uncharacterized protein n=1 Tax=Schizophyllum commune (strain H4-8 / FGSC 9210) TaxID=578458 RepID=UPI0021603141|nr:uncharacterized protein SCHCODRAFT_02360884 [Schizophyllum commune H4-8]KAI5889166.1 hypothetical protein SCHCODRAFT_02360884 [Schizophyllum commune H4-8]
MGAGGILEVSLYFQSCRKPKRRRGRLALLQPQPQSRDYLIRSRCPVPRTHRPVWVRESQIPTRKVRPNRHRFHRSLPRSSQICRSPGRSPPSQRPQARSRPVLGPSPCPVPPYQPPSRVRRFPCLELLSRVPPAASASVSEGAQRRAYIAQAPPKPPPTSTLMSAAPLVSPESCARTRPPSHGHCYAYHSPVCRSFSSYRLSVVRLRYRWSQARPAAYSGFRLSLSPGPPPAVPLTKALPRHPLTLREFALFLGLHIRDSIAQ